MNLSDPIFTDETAARAYFEEIRWDGKPVCPHCGETIRVYRLTGESHRAGLICCNGCGGSFTVTTGTVMESSHVALTKWALGFRLFAASKKGISASQLGRLLGVTYKTAWFMSHRIREAMTPVSGEIGGGGTVVEADETKFGNTNEAPETTTRGGKFLKRTPATKRTVVSLVERGGRVMSFYVKKADKRAINKIVKERVAKETRLHTDASRLYGETDTLVRRHETVTHSAAEYVRDDVSTNSVEGFFSVFKRGMVGTYQHCGEQHLQRYLNEFDFRANTRVALGWDDDARTEKMVREAEGKRLMYRKVIQA